MNLTVKNFKLLKTNYTIKRFSILIIIIVCALTFSRVIQADLTADQQQQQQQQQVIAATRF